VLDKKHKALFLDRDGIVNLDHGYVYKQEDFKFSQGIFELISLFIAQSYKIFIVTNQSGIARGYYTEADFKTLTSWMIETFKSHNIHIESVEYCPHLPTDGCNCRKPKTGMIDNILATWPIDLHTSYMIGDKQSDMNLAKEAGIEHTIAISNTPLTHANYTFKTIQAYKEYLDENQGKIL